jgi:oligopeptide/dipeptide ABC transporter ATP-binding protein
MPLLEVSNLHVEFRAHERATHAVAGVSFALEKGEIVGLVGESGCGKSVTSLSILGLLEAPAGRITQGSVRFNQKELTKLSQSELRKFRGNRISMIFQDPLTSLNPYLTVEEQLLEVATLHLGISVQEARRKAVELLTRVGIPEAEHRIRSYPHQLSGGMRQRVAMAMALLCGPDLLIADEPTTMLDVTIQAQILELLRELNREQGMSILFITHDLGIVSELCERVLVMYAGRIVEQAPSKDLFERPRHPYTEALLKSTPRAHEPHGGVLSPIGGLPPRLDLGPIVGCAFAPRCTRVLGECRTREPSLVELGHARAARCVLVETSATPAESRASTGGES